jgi:hypothetical protein
LKLKQVHGAEQILCLSGPLYHPGGRETSFGSCKRFNALGLSSNVSTILKDIEGSIALEINESTFPKNDKERFSRESRNMQVSQCPTVYRLRTTSDKAMLWDIAYVSESGVIFRDSINGFGPRSAEQHHKPQNYVTMWLCDYVTYLFSHQEKRSKTGYRFGHPLAIGDRRLFVAM